MKDKLDIKRVTNDKLIGIYKDGSLDDDVKIIARNMLLERTINAFRKPNRKVKNTVLLNFFYNYYKPLIIQWLKLFAKLNGTSEEIYKKKEEDWNQEVFERFYKMVRKEKFSWRKEVPYAYESLNKYLKSICRITILDDKDESIRKYKIEIQRSFRINIEKKVLSKNEKMLILQLSNKLPGESKTIIEIVIAGGRNKEICIALKIGSCHNRKDLQTAWNKKVSAYWRLYKIIEKEMDSEPPESLILLRDRLTSEVRGDFSKITFIPIKKYHR